MKLAIWISRFLEPDEREAVLGDLEEAEVRPHQALFEVGSLVLRRQSAWWRGWQPWAVSLFFVLPVGMLLTLCALEFQGDLGLYLWIIRNYRDMDTSLLRSTGLSPAHGILLIALRWLLLAITSWSNGFVLGALSRRTIVLTGLLFFSVLFVIQILLYLKFSSVGLSLFLLLALVVVPSVRGISQGISVVHNRQATMALWAAAIGIPVLFHYLSPQLRPSSEPLILVFWPLGYLLVRSFRDRMSVRTNL
jgi:hypothetical protein